MRPPWDEYFMLLAKIVALRSGCNSRPTGAIIVKDKRILATGYNGPMPGAWHCTDHGPNYCFRREKGIQILTNIIFAGLHMQKQMPLPKQQNLEFP